MISHDADMFVYAISYEDESISLRVDRFSFQTEGKTKKPRIESRSSQAPHKNHFFYAQQNVFFCKSFLQSPLVTSRLLLTIVSVLLTKTFSLVCTTLSIGLDALLS